MKQKTDRRTFIKGSVTAPAAAALAMSAQGETAPKQTPNGETLLPHGKIGNLEVSRLLLGGNLLTHFTHSRDLKYVYNLTAHYNTDEKILETLAVAEANGVNTLVIHTKPQAIEVLKHYRYKQGGKIQWIICPTAPINDGMEEYTKQVRELVDDGTEAIYVWGVQADKLVAKERVDLIAKAVEVAKECGVPSGVGAHDCRVITACEQNGVNADFYIKTFHHHDYKTGPQPEELTKPHKEIPGYWCNDPQAVIDCMNGVQKPWIAFKVMAAGAIPPQNAFEYAFKHGADHILAGMFDFEIEEDAGIVKRILPKVRRERPWRS